MVGYAAFSRHLADGSQTCLFPHPDADVLGVAVQQWNQKPLADADAKPVYQSLAVAVDVSDSYPNTHSVVKSIADADTDGKPDVKWYSNYHCKLYPNRFTDTDQNRDTDKDAEFVTNNLADGDGQPDAIPNWHTDLVSQSDPVSHEYPEPKPVSERHAIAVDDYISNDLPDVLPKPDTDCHSDAERYTDWNYESINHTESDSDCHTDFNCESDPIQNAVGHSNGYSKSINNVYSDTDSHPNFDGEPDPYVKSIGHS